MTKSSFCLHWSSDCKLSYQSFYDQKITNVSRAFSLIAVIDSISLPLPTYILHIYFLMKVYGQSLLFMTPTSQPRSSWSGFSILYIFPRFSSFIFGEVGVVEKKDGFLAFGCSFFKIDVFWFSVIWAASIFSEERSKLKSSISTWGEWRLSLAGWFPKCRSLPKISMPKLIRKKLWKMNYKRNVESSCKVFRRSEHSWPISL